MVLRRGPHGRQFRFRHFPRPHRPCPAQPRPSPPHDLQRPARRAGPAPADLPPPRFKDLQGRAARDDAFRNSLLEHFPNRPIANPAWPSIRFPLLSLKNGCVGPGTGPKSKSANKHSCWTNVPLYGVPVIIPK
jgi:hypothetical protein